MVYTIICPWTGMHPSVYHRLHLTQPMQVATRHATPIVRGSVFPNDAPRIFPVPCQCGERDDFWRVYVLCVPFYPSA